MKITVKEFEPDKPKETSFEITVLEEFIESKPMPDENGQIKIKEVKTKKIKQMKGPEEVIHEITEVTDKDTGESEVTIVSSSPIEAEDKEKPIKKEKRVKKIKKDDVEEFIQAVIEEDAPKETDDIIDVIEEAAPKQSLSKPKIKRKKQNRKGRGVASR